MYVGLVTVGAFAWWYLFFAGGPQITWKQLVSSLPSLSLGQVSLLSAC